MSDHFSKKRDSKCSRSILQKYLKVVYFCESGGYTFVEEMVLIVFAIDAPVIHTNSCDEYQYYYVCTSFSTSLTVTISLSTTDILTLPLQ